MQKPSLLSTAVALKESCTCNPQKESCTCNPQEESCTYHPQALIPTEVFLLILQNYVEHKGIWMANEFTSIYNLSRLSGNIRNETEWLMLKHLCLETGPSFPWRHKSISTDVEDLIEEHTEYIRAIPESSRFWSELQNVERTHRVIDLPKNQSLRLALDIEFCVCTMACGEDGTLLSTRHFEDKLIARKEAGRIIECLGIFDYSYKGETNRLLPQQCEGLWRILHSGAIRYLRLPELSYQSSLATNRTNTLRSLSIDIWIRPNHVGIILKDLKNLERLSIRWHVIQVISSDGAAMFHLQEWLQLREGLTTRKDTLTSLRIGFTYGGSFTEFLPCAEPINCIGIESFQRLREADIPIHFVLSCIRSDTVRFLAKQKPETKLPTKDKDRNFADPPGDQPYGHIYSRKPGQQEISDEAPFRAKGGSTDEDSFRYIYPGRVLLPKGLQRFVLRPYLMGVSDQSAINEADRFVIESGAEYIGKWPVASVFLKWEEGYNPRQEGG